MQHADIFAEEIIQATRLIIEWDLLSIIEGATAFVEAAKDLPSYLDLCVSAESDIHALESWATVFLRPVYLTETIKGNVANHPY